MDGLLMFAMGFLVCLALVRFYRWSEERDLLALTEAHDEQATAHVRTAEADARYAEWPTTADIHEIWRRIDAQRAAEAELTARREARRNHGTCE